MGKQIRTKEKRLSNKDLDDKTERSKSKMFPIPLLDEEKAELSRLAVQANLPLSTFIRVTMLAVARTKNRSDLPGVLNAIIGNEAS